MILRFLHGWGFDARCWREVCRLLPKWRIEVDDRGYFGNAKTIGADDLNIVVAHSFGTLRALRELPSGCKGLVAINGFDRFGASPGSPGIALRILDSMIAKLDRDPSAVVSNFRRRCGTELPFSTIEIGPLREDLLLLRNLDCTAVKADIPILSLQGATDPILSLSMRARVFSSNSRVLRKEHPAGGHLLPITHARYCATEISTFVEQVK